MPTRARPTLSLALIALLAAPAWASLKDVISDSVRALRAVQNDDGSYGAAADQPLATARVLEALGLCPDHYTTQEGPFVRNAARFLLEQQQEDGSFRAPADLDRIDVTADCLVALKLVAKTDAFQPAIESATRFLKKNGATRKAAARALGQGADSLVHVRRALVDDESIDADGRWIDTVGDRLGQEQVQALEKLDRDSVLSSANRLLAIIETNAATSRGGGGKPAASAAAKHREAPASREEEFARIQNALRYLDGAQQDGRFGFGSHVDAGITAIAIAAVVTACDRYEIDRPEYVAKGLAYLVSLQKEDGGIYDVGVKNYVTSISVEALVAAGDPAHRPVIDRALGFLTTTQIDEGEGYSLEEDPYYGGFGYGSSEKPDLSNTQMAIQAMHVAGMSPQDQSFQKAVSFLSRCQNRAESGIPSVRTWDDKEIVAGTDGGAVYRPGDSKAGTETNEDGKLVARSYGSMTYALLKSYLFSGIDGDDERVVEAVGWISRNYTLDVNPGFTPNASNAQYQGLYYYYLTMARALAAYGEATLEDSDGNARDWRRELRDRLFALQAEDGHWINELSSRWMEGNPVLTTSYALLALVETEPPR